MRELYAKPILIVCRREDKKHREGRIVGFASRGVSLLTAISATSAYFAPLVDQRMFKRLCRKMPWLWFYPRPHITLAPQANNARFTDGCVWDPRALGCALYTHKLMPSLCNLIILVVAPDPIDVFEWFQPRRRSSDVLDIREMLYFDDMEAHHVAYKRGRCLMSVCKNCRVRTDVWCPEWLIVGARVDLIVLTLDGRELNTVVFNQTPSYSVYEEMAMYHFTRAIANINASRPLILALSGGGTRAAIVGHAVLRVLKQHNIPPRAITACSGGAWGLVIYAQIGDRSGFTHLVRHGNMIVSKSHPQRMASAVMHYVLGGRVETIVNIYRALSNMQFEWKRLIRTMLFGAEPVMTWSELFARLPDKTNTVVMPSGIM